MLFLNSRARNPPISGVSMRNQPYTHKMGHSFIICGCLAIVTGLIFIVIGVISEIKKTTFVGIGIISLGVGFFLTTLVCLYGKLDTCYNNWAYRSRVLPVNIGNPRPPPIGGISHSPCVESPTTTQKQQSLMPYGTQAPITVVSDVEIHKVTIAASTQIGSTTNHSDNRI